MPTSTVMNAVAYFQMHYETERLVKHIHIYKTCRKKTNFNNYMYCHGDNIKIL